LHIDTLVVQPCPFRTEWFCDPAMPCMRLCTTNSQCDCSATRPSCVALYRRREAETCARIDPICKSPFSVVSRAPRASICFMLKVLTILITAKFHWVIRQQKRTPSTEALVLAYSSHSLLHHVLYCIMYASVFNSARPLSQGYVLLRHQCSCFHATSPPSDTSNKCMLPPNTWPGE
jgi:hypothetical protein